MLLVTIGLLFLTLIVKIWLKIRKNDKYMVRIPGPKHNKFFGNALDFLGNTENILPVLQKYTKTYGSLVKLHIGPASLGLLVTDEKFLEHMLSSNQLIDKAEHYRFLHNWLGTGLLTSTGSKWKKHRKIITSSFHFSILDNFIQIFEDNADILVNKFQEEIGQTSFDVFPYIRFCTLDILCESAMGTSINAQTNTTTDYVKSVKIMSKIAMQRTIFPIPNWIYSLTPNYYKEKKVLKIMHDHTNQVIDKKIQRNRNANNKNVSLDEFGIKKKIAFLDMLLNSSIEGIPFSKTEIREEVDTFMFAGHDTTATTISFALFEIAHNADIQEKLIQEQRNIFNDFKNAKPEMTHLQNMKYMELVIKESLRLFPPVCFLGRQLKEDLEWNGHLFPKNLNMILFMYDNFRNAKYFPEPLKFKPERFENQKLNNYIYTPFSAGPRNCIGQKFAMLEMKSVISKILRKYELKPATPVHHLKLVPDVVLTSKNGICISIKQRK